MQFEYPYLLILLLLLVPLATLLFSYKKSSLEMFDPQILKLLMINSGGLAPWSRATLLLLSMALMIVALARPIIDDGEIEVKSNSIELIVGFDISRSMFADDIYPDRLSLAKRKFDQLLHLSDGMRIGVVGFSSRSFLISPLSEDFSTLRYLVENMNTDTVSLKGTNILGVLQQADLLLKDSEKKAMLLFTDGGDSDEFSKEIEYAKKHKITLFICNIATLKGGIIKTDSGALTDSSGNIVIVRRNDKISTLAEQSGGLYVNYTLDSDDIKTLVDAIKSKFHRSKQNIKSVRDTQELFIYPLLLAILLLFVSQYSLPRRSRDVS